MRSLTASIWDSLQYLFWGKPRKEPWDRHAGRKPTPQEEAMWKQLLRQPLAVPSISVEELLNGEAMLNIEPSQALI